MVVFLSRVQFAFTVAFHFLFVPLTIGLMLLTAVFQTLHFVKREQIYKQLTEFWSELFIINFAVGIVTGLVMPVQFGTNWARYSVFMGDVFGSPLALEALLTFFLESTFAGIWIFKRNELSAGMRTVVAWLIVLGTSISSLWIITANGFMQHPVGYEISPDGTKVLMTSFSELLSNRYSLNMLVHTLLASILLGAFFMVGVSAYHLKRKKHVDFFRRSVKMASAFGLVAALLLPVQGMLYLSYIGQSDVQPTKAAILRNKADTEYSKPAEALTATNNTQKEAVTRKPPAKAIFVAFMLMQTLSVIFILYLLAAVIRSKLILENRLFQSLGTWFMILPYIAITAGWFVAEVGRQPWLVYRLMSVEDGISNVPVSNVIFSMFSLTVFYAVLFVMDYYLLRKKSVQGPQ